MKEVFATNGYKLRTNEEGPTVVTVVNASLAQADFDRDVKAANLTSMINLFCKILNVCLRQGVYQLCYSENSSFQRSQKEGRKDQEKRAPLRPYLSG